MKCLINIFKKNKRGESIIVVSGLPRSGTSLMMKMLEAGGIPPLTDGLREADEDNPKGYYEYERAKKLRDGDIAWLPEARDRVVKIISALLPHLPETYTYKVIFLEREMSEILASQKKMLVRRGEDPERVNDEEMARHFNNHLQQTYEWLSRQDNIEYLRISFNQLLENPDKNIPRIVAFLDRRLDTAGMKLIIDPALYRQRNS